VRAAVEQLCQAFWIEPDHEVIAVSDHGHACTACERSPFAQEVNILGYVEFFELTPVFG
jgi:hypothetical protein